MTAVSESAVTTTLRRAAARAMLAPSVHNTQPWRLVLTGDSLELYADDLRQLRVLDPRGRQLTISCGCALFNARVAITAGGFEPVVERLPDPDRPELLARVTIANGPAHEQIARLDLAVELRRTNRRRYADEPLPPWMLQELIAAAREETSRLFPIISDEHRRLTADLSELANRIENEDPDYLAELSAWTTDDPRRRDGVQAASVRYVATEPADHSADDVLPMRDFDLRHMGWLPPSQQAGIDENLVLLCSADDSPLGWLRTGEALQRIWLEITRHGFWACPLTQVVEVARTHEQLRTSLGLPEHPEILLRVGRAPDTVRTRRRLASDVIVEKH